METMKQYTTDGKVVHLSKSEDINSKLSRFIGKKYDDYRVKWDKANKFELVTEFPLFLHLDMNQKCNFKCPHCIVADEKLIEDYYNGDSLTFDEYTNIIDEGKDYGCPSVSVQGNNEPLLNKDLEKYIKYAADNNFIDIMLNSNASALTTERAKSLLDSGLTRIRFSIDAYSKEVFDKIRISINPRANDLGLFNKVIRNIENFLDIKAQGGYKLPITGVSFCRQKDNQHEEQEFISFWEDKVDSVSIQKYIPPVLEPGYEKFYSDDQKNSSTEFSGFKCVQPFQRVVIKNSEITPCCTMFSSRLKIGDTRKGAIYDAWHSEEMNELRDLHRKGEWYKNEICKQCVNLMYPESIGIETALQGQQKGLGLINI